MSYMDIETLIKCKKCGNNYLPRREFKIGIKGKEE